MLLRNCPMRARSSNLGNGHILLRHGTQVSRSEGFVFCIFSFQTLLMELCHPKRHMSWRSTFRYYNMQHGTGSDTAEVPALRTCQSKTCCGSVDMRRMDLQTSFG